MRRNAGGRERGEQTPLPSGKTKKGQGPMYTDGRGPVHRHEFFETTGVTDYRLAVRGRPPRGYPAKERPDRYSPRPFATTGEERRRAFLAHAGHNPARDTLKGHFLELARLASGRGPVHAGLIEAALDYIDERRDCSDFVMLGIVRMMYMFGRSPLLDKRLVSRAERTLLSFKYWPDEPGVDSMCTWTENHQIMFAVNEYLAGQLFPDRTFEGSGLTGVERMERARRRILRWMEMRYLTGFSEWLSNVYYDEDITAMANLVDFCSDETIRRRAPIILDLIFLDMALNSLDGVFGSTHGRSYAKEKRFPFLESTTDTSKLLFGAGVFAGADNMSAVSLALGGYRLPRVIYAIANDRNAMENRQRMGIRLAEAGRWGMDLNDPECVMETLGLEAYAHPRTITAVMRLFDSYRWWDNDFFAPFASKRRLITAARKFGLLPLVARLFEKDITRNTREEVNIYTYRTAEYMLSSAQDYRPGYGGDQQHVWQASLGSEAVCFTTHPGKYEDGSIGYWTGSGRLPRAAQIKNVLMCVYNIKGRPGIYHTDRLFFTHAWLPRDRFDEVRERAGWVFARRDNAYLALYSRNGYRWREDGPDSGRELIADGAQNIWLCELGGRFENGPFDAFVEAISNSPPEFGGLRVRYSSPSVGRMDFGWSGPLRLNGSVVPLSDYPRYDNPHCRADFPPGEIVARHGKHTLRLDYRRGVREASGFA